LTDSLQLYERRDEFKFARIAYETDEITKEKEQAIKQRRITLYVASAVLLTAFLLFIIRIQRARQKELLLLAERQKSDESIYRLIHDRQAKIDEGRRSEKKRIARELHDGVMNKLTSTRLNLFVLNKKQDDETIQKCLKLIDGLQDIEKEIRQVAHDLNDEVFRGTQSFNLLLEGLFNDFKQTSDTELHPEIEPQINWEVIDSAIKMNIYRILQESLLNCQKYAGAKNIYVTLSRENDVLHFVIYDDGKGFDTGKPRKGIGIKNMQSRVEALNGKFALLSHPGGGTTLRMEFPIEPL
jgi:signal transduction histidine kinase